MPIPQLIHSAKAEESAPGSPAPLRRNPGEFVGRIVNVFTVTDLGDRPKPNCSVSPPAWSTSLASDYPPAPRGLRAGGDPPYSSRSDTPEPEPPLAA